VEHISNTRKSQELPRTAYGRRCAQGDNEDNEKAVVIHALTDSVASALVILKIRERKEALATRRNG